MARIGHPALIGRHRPFPVTHRAAERWLHHMQQALDGTQSIDPDSNIKMMNFFRYPRSNPSSPDRTASGYNISLSLSLQAHRIFSRGWGRVEESGNERSGAYLQARGRQVGGRVSLGPHMQFHWQVSRRVLDIITL